jgi:hypothetical protein
MVLKYKIEMLLLFTAELLEIRKYFYFLAQIFERFEILLFTATFLAIRKYFYFFTTKK